MNISIEHFSKLIYFEGNSFVETLVERYGNEFIPPLNTRNSSTQQVFNNSSDSSNNEYFEKLLEQPALIIFIDSTPIGFMSYIKNYKLEFLKDFLESNYITTIIINPEYRRLGAAKKLYQKLLTVEKGKFTTRTWSSNLSHINLLNQLGFNLIHEIANHRGEGIHTVYYGFDNDSHT
ncbi:GNAT family N-acetyltransferase [Marivirga salinae]|uniref:GNAT family N-acetyltransferase n=1 Tax=Marivirga salinarum TaxID=3059078 RepID=A0AA51NEI5_9BACT|nr:GNAT family N-acetyltransferase [Marivirga sp. BDSF4-3]WMN12806.1 GNAT family N-acetyltransferase [Marivirga sp. BDSF4-3]